MHNCTLAEYLEGNEHSLRTEKESCGVGILPGRLSQEVKTQGHGVRQGRCDYGSREESEEGGPAAGES